MKFQKLKNMVQLTSLIFTGIAAIEAAAGQTLNSRTVWEILFCAAAAALLKFFFFSENLFESSILRQTVYLFLVWLIFLLYNYMSGRGLSKGTALSILAEVLIIYFVIRLINYQLVKLEVKRMNRRLQKSEDRKKDQTSS